MHREGQQRICHPVLCVQALELRGYLGRTEGGIIPWWLPGATGNRPTRIDNRETES